MTYLFFVLDDAVSFVSSLGEMLIKCVYIIKKKEEASIIVFICLPVCLYVCIHQKNKVMKGRLFMCLYDYQESAVVHYPHVVYLFICMASSSPYHQQHQPIPILTTWPYCNLPHPHPVLFLSLSTLFPTSLLYSFPSSISPFQFSLTIFPSSLNLTCFLLPSFLTISLHLPFRLSSSSPHPPIMHFPSILSSYFSFPLFPPISFHIILPTFLSSSFPPFDLPSITASPSHSLSSSITLSSTLSTPIEGHYIGILNKKQ